MWLNPSKVFWIDKNNNFYTSDIYYLCIDINNVWNNVRKQGNAIKMSKGCECLETDKSKDIQTNIEAFNFYDVSTIERRRPVVWRACLRKVWYDCYMYNIVETRIN